MLTFTSRQSQWLRWRLSFQTRQKGKDNEALRLFLNVGRFLIGRCIDLECQKVQTNQNWPEKWEGCTWTEIVVVIVVLFFPPKKMTHQVRNGLHCLAGIVTTSDSQSLTTHYMKYRFLGGLINSVFIISSIYSSCITPRYFDLKMSFFFSPPRFSDLFLGSLAHS